MKILVWSEKHGDVLVYARTLEEEARAWLYLFKCMDDMGYYGDLEGDEPDAYKAAKKGNAKAAKWLLGMRSDYEYERVTVEYPVVP